MMISSLDGQNGFTGQIAIPSCGQILGGPGGSNSVELGGSGGGTMLAQGGVGGNGGTGITGDNGAYGSGGGGSVPLTSYNQERISGDGGDGFAFLLILESFQCLI